MNHCSRSQQLLAFRRSCNLGAGTNSPVLSEYTEKWTKLNQQLKALLSVLSMNAFYFIQQKNEDD